MCLIKKLMDEKPIRFFSKLIEVLKIVINF
jgi:hypothetical protein